jgi:hypothetical protein
MTQNCWGGNLFVKLVADFPMKAEGIYYTAEAPAVFFGYWENLSGAGLQRASEGGIRVRDD